LGGKVKWGERVGKGQREKESQAGSMPSTEPDVGLNPTTPRSRPEPKSRVGCLMD